LDAHQDHEAALEELESAVELIRAETARRVRRRRSAPLVGNVATAAIIAGCLALLGAAPVAPRVRAPFTVVGPDNKKIFEVTGNNPRGFQLFNEAGRSTALGVVSDQATFIKASSPDANTQAVLGVVADKSPSLALRYGGPVKTRLALAVADDKPELDMNNEAGIPIVLLGEAPGGHGHLQLGAADGNARVLAGMTPGGVGAVQTFPDGNPGRTFFGLPGTFICGIGCGK
jgi:hypothetical protein